MDFARSSYLILFALYILIARESRGGILLASPQPAGLNFGGMFGGRYTSQYILPVVQSFFFFLVSPFSFRTPPGTGNRDSRLAIRGRKSEVAVTDDGQFVSPDLRFGRPPGPPSRDAGGIKDQEGAAKEQFSRRNQIPPSARPPIS